MKSSPPPIEEVKVAIKEILPEFGTEQLNHLVGHLTRNHGVENCDDLRDVEMKDIQELLTPAHCQKLLHSCKKTGEPSAVLKGTKSPQAPLEEVKAAVKDMLPELEMEKLNSLVDHLTRVIGVEHCDDFKYVEMQDVQELLTPAQCQKLLHSCKKTGEPSAVLKGTKSPQAPLEEVKTAVKDMLPELEMEKLNSLVDHLTRVIGVEHCDDFKYVEMRDVQELLTPAQCQKLLQSCKKTGSLTGQVLPSFPSSPQPSKSGIRKKGEPLSLPIGSPALPTRPPKINLSRSWVNSFRVPWERTAPRLREAMAKGHRADPADRRHMIRAIVGKMLWYCPNPNRKACAEVARAIVAKYPHTFGDLTEEGELLGTGYHSLLTQIKTRVENVNRNNVVNRIRRPKRSNTDHGFESSSRPAKYLRTNVDSYGCISWQPSELPVGETEETLESKRQELVAIFNKLGPSGVALAEVNKFMSVTYISQRQMINRCPPPSICEVQQQWPFLFTQKGLLAHFQRLMGVEIESRLSDSLSNKGRRIVNFFQGQKTKWSTEMQCLLSEIQGNVNGSDRDLTAIAAIMLVMKRFKEKEDSVFLSANACATKTDIEEQLALPVSPRLIMLGNSPLTATRWMVSIEGKVAYVLEDNSNFAAALAVFFSCYYVFNMEYQEAACATLELIQRFFVRINPEYGMKCTAKVGVSRSSGAIVQRKASAVNSHVTTFLLQLMQFQWRTQT